MIQIQLAGVIPLAHRHGVSGGFPAYYCYDVMFSWLPGTVFFHLPQLAAHPYQHWRGLQAISPLPT